MRKLLLFALVPCGVICSLLAATIVIGGSVENGNFENGGEWAGPRGWDGQYITDPASAFEGARFLQGSSVGQRFFVYPKNGLAFELSFYARAGAAPLDEIIVSFTSPYTPEVPQLTLGETPPPSTTWQHYTAAFVFEQPWSMQEQVWVLGFQFLHNGTATLGQIDAVTLRQVPEPSAASILLCGAFALAACRWPHKTTQRSTGSGDNTAHDRRNLGR